MRILDRAVSIETFVLLGICRQAPVFIWLFLIDMDGSARLA